MAIDDATVLTPAVGHVFTATSGTDPWTATQIDTFVSAGTVPSGWDELGHTDLDTPLTFAQDGGDSETKGSWQNPSLKTVITSAAVDSFTVNAEQVLDTAVLSYYYGGGDDSTPNEFALPDAPAAQEKAFMVVMVDGTTGYGMGGAKCSILRADAQNVASDDFLKLPLKFTILKASGKPRMTVVSSALNNDA